MAERKEEVVISGISGAFPECENIDEFKELLFNKTNGVTIDSRRWKPSILLILLNFYLFWISLNLSTYYVLNFITDTLGAISGTGKLKNIDKFDATFFSAHSKLAEVMDDSTRLFLEKSIEAIIDAGLGPTDLSGTNTSVFTGFTISDADILFINPDKSRAFSMLGQSKAMQANRVSYVLNLTGILILNTISLIFFFIKIR